MKALVAASRTGRRLRQVSPATHLLPLANRPILGHVLDELAASDITDVVLVVGDHATEIRRVLGGGSLFGVAASYLHQPASRGLAEDVLAAQHLLHDDGFVVHEGHTVTLGTLPTMVKEFRVTRPEALVLTAGPASASESGFVYVDDDGAVRRVEDGRHRPGPLAVPLMGVYAFSPVVLQALHSLRPTWDRRLETTDALRWLIERGYAVRAHACQGYAAQVTQVGDLLAANATILETLGGTVEGDVDPASVLNGPVVVGGNARVVRSRVNGPAVIGPDSVVVDCVLGPYTSLGPDCAVLDAGVSRSVLLPGARIRAARIRDSVVGGDALVEGYGKAAALRLVVGDRAQLLLERPSSEDADTQATGTRTTGAQTAGIRTPAAFEEHA
ncbi:sugar phosphate nucleotidyltransferase [Nonomuraea sp. NPDC049158]|uniref:sugar phosphate nucleotidyltransferase n=1 Tax=Nonomuraea sp. NPDC049158 TaxID=3155649 RepID=UPI0033E97D52